MCSESYSPRAVLASWLPLGPELDRALNYPRRSLPSGGPVFSRARCRDDPGGLTTPAPLDHRRVGRHHRRAAPERRNEAEMKRTFQPNTRKRSRRHGFRHRMATRAGARSSKRGAVADGSGCRLESHATQSRTSTTMGSELPVLREVVHVPRPRPVHSRLAFTELRRSKRRVFSEPLRVQFLPAPKAEEARRVAFAVPRKVGTAVERNRCRRRLRSVVAEITASLPAGTYLVAVDQGVRDLSFQELRARVIEAMQRASQVGAP